jgi:hypothetical protein
MDWELTIVSSQKYKLPETFKSYCAIETETNLTWSFPVTP